MTQVMTHMRPGVTRRGKLTRPERLRRLKADGVIRIHAKDLGRTLEAERRLFYQAAYRAGMNIETRTNGKTLFVWVREEA